MTEQNQDDELSINWVYEHRVISHWLIVDTDYFYITQRVKVRTEGCVYKSQHVNHCTFWSWNSVPHRMGKPATCSSIFEFLKKFGAGHLHRPEMTWIVWCSTMVNQKNERGVEWNPCLSELKDTLSELTRAGEKFWDWPGGLSRAPAQTFLLPFQGFTGNRCQAWWPHPCFCLLWLVGPGQSKPLLT